MSHGADRVPRHHVGLPLQPARACLGRAGGAGGRGRPGADGCLPAEIARHFRFGSQEDAHEFLRYTIDAMQKACLNGCTRYRGQREAAVPQPQVLWLPGGPGVLHGAAPVGGRGGAAFP